jgi:hypothetical protein
LEKGGRNMTNKCPTEKSREKGNLAPRINVTKIRVGNWEGRDLRISLPVNVLSTILSHGDYNNYFW